MALFGRRRRVNAPEATNLQPPDEYARRGAVYYGNQDFANALDMYGEAIDKLHTMYVFPAPQDRRRQPSVADESILQGFISSLGAALAMDPSMQVGARVEKAINYLGQIARVAQREDQASAGRYLAAIDDITLAAKLGKRDE